MNRPRKILVVAVAGVAFLLVSFALGRVLNVNGAERAAIASLLDAQGRGDAPALIAGLDGCAEDGVCRATATANAAELSSREPVELVRLDLSTSFSLGGTTGTARVVWATPRRLTVVQCARVLRDGDVLSGIHVKVQALSRPIGREESCPSS